MSSEIALGALGASSVIGGVEAPIARLCGGLNLIRQNRFEFGVTSGTDHWVSGDTQLAAGYDPSAIMGRNVLLIRDASASTAAYGSVYVRNGSDINGTSWIFSCWIKANVASVADCNIRVRAEDLSAMIGDADGSPGALAADEWVFFSRVFTWTGVTAGEEDFTIEFFPERAPASATGTIAISNPRCHRLAANVSDLPDWPLRDWSFEPWLRTKGVRDRFGSIEVSRRGWIPRIRARHPVTNFSQLQAVGAIYAHDGPIFFEPNVDGEIAFWMTTNRDTMDYQLLGDRAIGYEGELELVGIDPVYGIPDATLYIEEENVAYYGIPRYVRAI